MNDVKNSHITGQYDSIVQEKKPSGTGNDVLSVFQTIYLITNLVTGSVTCMIK